MIAMTLPEIAVVVRGRVYDDSGDSSAIVSGPAFLDSRVVELGGLFVALAGGRVDGHDFARMAMAAGAAAVLGSRPLGLPMVVAEDPLVALGRLAHHLVDHLPDLTVVALTGSQGKTSTKDLLARVLSDAGRTVATVGSLNNELGVPLTVLRAGPRTDYLVLEMGSRGIGHLRYLCEIVRPDVSLVLNVGKAHLGEFGTQADIASAKAELVEALDPAGIAVLNADDALVRAMATRTSARVTSYGQRAGADLLIENLHVDDTGRPSFDLARTGAREHVQLQLLGEHQAVNAAAAAAVATAVGVPLDRVARSLGEVSSTSRWRMEPHELAGGITLINDSYNANPDSMRAALKTLAAIGRGRSGPTRTIAVLGEMRELGESSPDEHDAVGRLVVRLDINQLVVVGEPARPMHLGACHEGSWAEGSVFVRDNEEVFTWLQENLVAGDVVLFKASRAAELERVVDAMINEASTVADGEVATEPKEADR